jgi:hypothetical protein
VAAQSEFPVLHGGYYHGALLMAEVFPKTRTGSGEILIMYDYLIVL